MHYSKGTYFKYILRYRTVFENHRKSLIQHCERSKLRLHFEWTKVNFEMPKMANFWRLFENVKLAVKQFYQTGQFYKDKN